MVVRTGIACPGVPLCTSLEAVAARGLMYRLINIVSSYVPPHVPHIIYELEGFSDQLPEPFLILCDFNAHNLMASSDGPDSRGRVI